MINFLAYGDSSRRHCDNVHLCVGEPCIRRGIAPCAIVHGVRIR